MAKPAKEPNKINAQDIRYYKELKHLASFPELNPNPIFETDLNGSITYANTASKKAFPDLIKKGLDQDLLTDFQLVLKHLKRGTKHSFQREITAGGKVYESNIHYLPHEGRVRFYNLDITRRKEAEKRQVEMDQRFQAIFEQSPLGILINDLNHRPLLANANYLKMLGYTFDELTSFKVSDYTNTEDYLRESKLDRKLHTGEIDSYSLEKRYIAKSGRTIWVHLSASMLTNRQGKRQYHLRMAEDITARKQTEMRLKQKEDLLKSSQEIAKLGSWELDVKAKKLSWSDETYRIFGLEPHSTQSTYKLFLETIHPDDRKAVDRSFKNSINKGQDSYNAEFRIVRKNDGAIRYVKEKGHNLKDEAGQVIRSVGVAQDITDLKIGEIEREKLIDELSYEKKQAQNELSTVKILLEVAANLNSWTDLDPLLSSLSDIIFRFTNVPRIFINLMDLDKQLLIPKIATGGLRAPTQGEPVPLSKLSQISQQAIKARKTTILDYEDAGVSEYDKNIAKANSAKVVLFVPLLYQNRIIGHISVDEPGKRREFSKREIQVLEGIASQASVVIENVRLFEAERHIADTLQKAIIKAPKKIRGVRFGHTYRSATEAAKVGGDFYDIFEMEGQKIGVIVGDVSGKGVEAATLTSLIRNTLQAYLFQGDSPGIALRKVNTIAYSTTDASSFITLVCGVLDVKKMQFTYCNAGHPAGLLKVGDKISDLGCESAAIGAFREIQYNQNTVKIPKRGMLIFYTDGVTEARNSKGRFFNNKGLRASAKADIATEQMPIHILDEVLSFSGGMLSDDLAIIAISLENGTTPSGNSKMNLKSEL